MEEGVLFLRLRIGEIGLQGLHQTCLSLVGVLLLYFSLSILSAKSSL